MGDQREDRWGGGHWSKSSRGEGEQPAHLPSPRRLKSCEENKVYCLERGGKSM